jgi:microcystin-dependent protein
MSQHDYILDNQAGAQFRSDLNNALAAVATVNSGATTPATTYAYQLWADTTTGMLKQRNAANNAWVTLFPLATTVDPSGTIKLYAGGTAPTGYLICDGTAVSRTTYADLFAVLSTTYGSGDGSTTFNVPDFRRRVPVGAGGTGTATLGNARGNTGGAETHTITEAQLPAHKHFAFADVASTSATATNVTSSTQSTRELNDGTSSSNFRIKSTSTAATLGLTSSTGNGEAHNNMQPSLIVNYIIKT